jgi:hypothetical protein
VQHKIEDGGVTEFSIWTDEVTDIAPIRVFNALKSLQLHGMYVGKPQGVLADLTPLKEMNMAGLRHLDLDSTRVTDAGLACFENCKDLLALRLDNMKLLTDAGLTHFKDCKRLKFLSLARTNVRDVGLIHFKGCKDLTQVSLLGTNANDAGLAHLKDSPLKALWIYETGITDLTPLQGMPLEHIGLTPTNITRGLEILREMKSLKTVGTHQFLLDPWAAAEFWKRYDNGDFTATSPKK